MTGSGAAVPPPGTGAPRGKADRADGARGGLIVATGNYQSAVRLLASMALRAVV